MKLARPGSTDQLFVDWGSTGASLGVRVDDLEGATTIARTTGFVESPAGSGLYYLEDFTFPEDGGSYALIYDDDAGVYALGHTATEDLLVSDSYPDIIVSGDTYADTTELFRILKIRNPTAEQTTAAERVLLAATVEIRHELDFVDGTDDLDGEELALAQAVCLERAVEHWQQQELPFGLVGHGVDGGSSFVRTDTWERHAHKLAPLKRQWGLA